MKYYVVTFIILNFVMILYMLSSFRKKVPLIFELSFILLYALNMIIVIFPRVVEILHFYFGIYNILVSILFIFIFILYILVYLLFVHIERQRKDITKLVTELALENKQKDDSKK